MKTLRLFVMAFVAILTTVSLASCSKDENPEKNEEGVVNNEKKIATFSQGGYSYSFKYDDKGRMIEAGFRGSVCSFVWKENVIKVITADSETYDVMIDNGLIQSDYHWDTFIYDNNNRLLLTGDSDGNRIRYIWNEDKLVSISEDDDYKYEIIYDGKCKKGYFPFLGTIVGDYEMLAFVHPELQGWRTQQLPSKVTAYYKGKVDYSSTFTYEFDKDGYISKITQNEDGDIYAFALTWK